MSRIILVAFEVEDAATEREAQERLMPALLPVLESRGGPAACWWIAEDERHDGSDNDSAVFVTPGLQAAASRLLVGAGLTPVHNLITGGEGR